MDPRLRGDDKTFLHIAVPQKLRNYRILSAIPSPSPQFPQSHCSFTAVSLQSQCNLSAISVQSQCNLTAIPSPSPSFPQPHCHSREGGNPRFGAIRLQFSAAQALEGLEQDHAREHGAYKYESLGLPCAQGHNGRARAKARNAPAYAKHQASQY